MLKTQLIVMLLLLPCLICMAGGTVWAEEDLGDLIQADDLFVEQPQANVVNFNQQINEQQFEQWIFQGSQNAQQGRKRLETAMELQVDAVDQLCQLTDSQRQKLYLAGRGDIARFFTGVDLARAKFRETIKKQKDANGFNQVWNEVWQDISPLQQQLSAGLFDDSSLLRKAVHHTLDPEQSSKYEAEQFRRRKFMYHARLALFVDDLEGGMPLTADQRREFLVLLKLHTRPPRKFGHNDYDVMMYEVSKIPTEMIKQIFDETQWDALQKPLKRAKQMEQHLRRQKIIQ